MCEQIEQSNKTVTLCVYAYFSVSFHVLLLLLRVTGCTPCARVSH
jgi:hypothetical protein